MKITVSMISLFLFLSGASVDEYYLARAIEGEGAHLVDKDLGYAIGRSVLNRMDAGWCSSVVDCIDRGYWGIVNTPIPNQWSLDIARDVLAYRNDRNLCGPGREWCFDAFYVFSLSDRQRLRIGDEYVLAVEMSASGRLGFVFCGKDTRW